MSCAGKLARVPPLAAGLGGGQWLLLGWAAGPLLAPPDAPHSPGRLPRLLHVRRCAAVPCPRPDRPLLCAATAVPRSHLSSYSSWTACMWQFITDPSVGQAGVMTKRISRTGGDSPTSDAKDGGKGMAAVARLFTPASAMPLLRGITPAAIH